MRNVITDTIYNHLPLSNTAKNNQGFYKEILDVIGALFSNMFTHHGRVLFVMFTVKYPTGTWSTYPDDNSLMSRFIEALTLHYKRKKGNPRYLWVREASSTGQAHYHVMLLLNSDHFQNGYGVLAKATDLWQRCLNINDGRGLIHLCTSGDDKYGGVKINRNDPLFNQIVAQCYERASYLAKRYSKGGAPAYVNEFGCSRLA